MCTHYGRKTRAVNISVETDGFAVVRRSVLIDISAGFTAKFIMYVTSVLLKCLI
jgi:hypothetical protein